MSGVQSGRGRPSQALLATVSAVAASAAIGVLLGAYVHEARADRPVVDASNSAPGKVTTSVSTSTVVVTMDPETVTRTPREVAESKPVRTHHHVRPTPTTTAPTPTPTTAPAPPPQTVTARPLPASPVTCSLLDCLIGG